MTKEEKQLLLGLATIGIIFLLSKTKSAPKEEDSESIGLGKLPPDYIKVGRINMTTARKAHIKAGDVVFWSNQIEHIIGKHGEQLRNMGISPADYFSIVVNNFTQIRQGSDDSILLIINGLGGMHVALALRMKKEIDDKKAVWEIHTLFPISKFKKAQKLLWER